MYSHRNRLGSDNTKVVNHLGDKSARSSIHVKQTAKAAENIVKDKVHNTMRAVTNSSLSGQQSRSGGTRRRKQYFRLGRDTKAVDEFSEGASGSEFPVSYKQLKRSR